MKRALTVLIAIAPKTLHADPPEAAGPATLTPASESTPVPDPPELSAGRLAAEAGLGIVAGGGGIVVGAGVGMWANYHEESCRKDSSCYIEGAAFGGFAGYVLTVPLGVYVAGSYGDQTGSLAWTYVGSVTGGLLGMAAVMVNDDMLFSLAAGPLTCSMVAFNLTRRYEKRAPRSWVPTAQLTSERATFGLAGRF